MELAYQIGILDLKWDFCHPAVRWWGNRRFWLSQRSQATGFTSYPDVCFCEDRLSWCIHLDQSLVHWGLTQKYGTKFEEEARRSMDIFGRNMASFGPQLYLKDSGPKSWFCPKKYKRLSCWSMHLSRFPWKNLIGIDTCESLLTKNVISELNKWKCTAPTVLAWKPLLS